jgi:hypothetical protein
VREAEEGKEGATVGVGDGGAIALYIGAAAAVRHRGKSRPSWPTAATRPTAVAHDGKVLRGPHPAPDRWR